MIKRLSSVLVAALLCPVSALAGDGVTMIFRSGQVVLIDNGYKQIVDAMKSLNDEKDVRHRIVALDIGGDNFMLNLAELVVVCRDTCKSLTVQHQLAARR